MSHNQPGPYGQQPPPGPPPGQPGPYGAPPPHGPGPGGPNPYAQGGVPSAPPGYGYPQQPGPYGGQPPGGGYPGHPTGPMPQAPPPGSNKNKTIGIVVGIVVAIAVLGAGLFFVLRDDDGGGLAADDGTRYELDLPETFDGYTMISPENSGDITEEEMAELGVSGAEAAGGLYLAGADMEDLAEMMDPSELGDTEVQSLFVAGLWGEVEDPEAAVDAFFAIGAAEQDEDMTLLGQPESVSPSGLDDAIMKCQLAETTHDSGELIEVPVCVWADYSTLSMAGHGNENGHGPLPVSIDEAAEITAQLRTASLSEIE